MSENNFNNHNYTLRVLIAPLDWGLGHATRCIPIINDLMEKGCEVWIAADKQVLSLLEKEFPYAVFLRCKGYEIRYSKQKRFLSLKIISQIPHLFFSIWHEKEWLKKMIKEYSIDAVISDNRFGMHNKKIPSIYITHQLCIKTGNRISDFFARKIHSCFIKKYTQCWVPDSEKYELAGELSHPGKVPPNTVYIGPLSRFSPLTPAHKNYDLLITISGPEPQRTIFERTLLKELESFSGTAFLIRGLPGEHNVLSFSNKFVTIVNHLPAKELNRIIEQSEMIISRSGYTSVMDLAALNKHAILIPTPGQTEQEYLAKYLYEKRFFYSTEEENFSLKKVLEDVKDFEFRSIPVSHDDYRKTIDEFVLSLKTLKFAPQ
ncbi:MAG: glycosyltransferase [Ginsengibacter sp.]